MSKKRGYRSDVGVIDEVIPEEVKEEVLEAVEESEAEPVIVTTEPQVGKVTAFTLNVRENPSVESRVIKVIGRNDEVKVFDGKETDGWYPVLLNDETKGYCMSKFIEIIN